MLMRDASFVLENIDGECSPEPLKPAFSLAQRFGELLREYRRAADLTQEELAERAGVSPRSISGLERGEGAIPRRDTIDLLTRALGLTGEQRENLEAIVLRVRAQRQPRLPLRTPTTQQAQNGSLRNLPRALDSFVGREQDMRELGPLLLSAPVVTLVGPGGVGKTRLAFELARRHLSQFLDGGYLVELGEVTDPGLVACAVATAIGIGDFCGRDTLQVMREYLRSKQVLLVIDNCEHVVDACAELLETLLPICPEVHVLATSREGLGIKGEMVWLVRPLNVPDPTAPPNALRTTREPAARLFVQRARAANSLFLVDDDNAAAITRVCLAVDGIPLALELAAARMRLMTVEQLADRLEHDLYVLRGGIRSVPVRHETMRATIGWSHDLLEHCEQTLLRRLAVFRGGWTLEMAEEICAGSGIDRTDVLDLLAQLVDKSMVQVATGDASARYRLLAPIRQYALEQLELSGEAPDYMRRHGVALLSLPRAGQADDVGPGEIASLDRFEVEHANLRAALRWALAEGEPELALRAASTLFRFWERRGHLQEGCAWLEDALKQSGETPSPFRATALNALAFLYWRMGEAERALPIAEQGLVISRKQATPIAVAFALGNLGAIALLRDQPEQALTWLTDSVSLGREIGYAPFISVAQTLLARSLVRLHGPWFAPAAELLQQSLSLAESGSARYAMAQALLSLGDLHWARGHPSEAVGFWRRTLLVSSELGDPKGMAVSVECMARGFAARCDFARAVWLFGAADSAHRMLGIDVRSSPELDVEDLLGQSRAALGDAFADTWEAGQSATLDEAAELALEVTVADGVGTRS